MRGPTPILTVEELRAYQASGGRAIVGASKYGNHALWHEGVRYHSKAELRFEFRLRLLQKLGKVDWWTRQVPFTMPADARTTRAEVYRLDFQVVMPKHREITLSYPGPAGRPDIGRQQTDLVSLRLIDVKGFENRHSMSKIATINATFHVAIEIVRPDDVETWI